MRKDIKMLKKERDKRIADVVVAVLMVIWSIGSIFGFIGFARSCKSTPVVTASAYTADDVMGVYPRTGCLASQTTFTCVGDFSSFRDSYYFGIPFAMNLSVDDTYYQNYAVLLTDNSVNYEASEDSLYIFMESSTISVREDYYFFCFDNRFLDRQVKIELFPVVDSPIECYFSVSTYITSYDFVSSYVENAHDAGYNEGYEQGERNGFESGKSQGYDAGYAKGVADSNEYSWNGLIGSVIDVPVRAFTSLFNFEILGVNMASFFFALLSVCIVLVVIKMIL